MGCADHLQVRGGLTGDETTVKLTEFKADVSYVYVDCALFTLSLSIPVHVKRRRKNGHSFCMATTTFQ